MGYPEKSAESADRREDERVLSFDGLEKKIGYHFRDSALLEKAMRHRSYVNETGAGRAASNERLEFLGDAVLELASSEALYVSRPQEPEGVLSRMRASMVCEEALSEKAEALDLGTYLLLGKGEDMSGGRKKPSVTSDALEALIGAIYLDGGYDAAAGFISTFILNDVETASHSDYKSTLQERVQKDGVSRIEYRLTAESGPDHAKEFAMEAVIDGKVCGRGRGHSKKTAEQMAAKDALTAMGSCQE